MSQTPQSGAINGDGIRESKPNVDGTLIAASRVRDGRIAQAWWLAREPGSSGGMERTNGKGGGEPSIRAQKRRDWKAA